MKRILITEEALRDREGHWFEYNRATKAALLEFDPTLEIEMLGHCSMEGDVAAELPAKPHFRYTVWEQIYNQPQAWRRYLGILQHNYRLYVDLARHLRTNRKYETIFAPTVVLHHLLGYHRLATKFGGKKFDQLILLVRNNIALYDASGNRRFRSTAKFWRWAIQRFRPLLHGGRVRFVTDSERLADEYEELTGIRFEVLPHPSLIGLGTAAATPATDTSEQRPYRFFLPGPSRYEKGTDRLLDAVQLIQQAATTAARGNGVEGHAVKDLKPGTRIEITLQWAEPFSLPDGTTLEPEDYEATTSDDDTIQFRILRQSLSSAEYQAELQRADCIVLPYRRETYFARISGVAVEAMLLGKPLLYTSNTWVGTLAEQFGTGLGVDDNSAAVCDGLIGMIESNESMAQRALSAREQVESFFSAEAFASGLFAHSAV